MEKERAIKNILSKRRVLIAILICLSVTALLLYLETRDANLDFQHLNFNSYTILYLFLAILMMAFRDLGYMVRIRILTENVLSWRQSFNVIMLWEFASALTPGVVGGSAVAMFILRKEKIPLGKATALVIVSLIMDNLFYIIFLPLIFITVASGSLIPHNISWLQGEAIVLIWIGYSIILGITILLLVSVLWAPGLIRAIVRVIFKLPFLKNRKEDGEQIGRDVMLSAKALRGQPFSFWFNSFLATIWSWTSRYLVINFLLLAFFEIGIWENLLILARQLVMWLIMLITPTPGGSGMAEFLFTEFLSNMVAGGGIAITLAFIWRMISYYPYLIIGSILLPRWLRKK